MPNPNINITTPRGILMQVKTKSGGMTARLEWNPGYGAKHTGNFNKAQMFIDNEVLRFCSARVPFQTGMLQKSGILGTTIGSGWVCYIAPYSSKQYHTAQSRGYDANRGGMWFERGKAAERNRILQGAAKIAAGGA